MVHVRRSLSAFARALTCSNSRCFFSHSASILLPQRREVGWRREVGKRRAGGGRGAVRRRGSAAQAISTSDRVGQVDSTSLE
jgi:hypothetical protein